LLIKIPFKAFSSFSRIFRLAGSEGLVGIQNEAVPTQDLNRMLQTDRVRHYLFEKIDAPAATGNVDVQWGDVSDWDEVQVNGIVSILDAEMPLTTEDRFVVAVSLQISGTEAEYTTAQALRGPGPTAGGTLQLLQEFGVLVTGHLAAPPIAPGSLLPQRLVIGEDAVRFRQVVSGANAVFNWTIHMIVAEPGVLAAYPGF